jgi:hypothetical protein
VQGCLDVDGECGGQGWVVTQQCDGVRLLQRLERLAPAAARDAISRTLPLAVPALLHGMQVRGPLPDSHLPAFESVRVILSGWWLHSWLRWTDLWKGFHTVLVRCEYVVCC